MLSKTLTQVHLPKIAQTVQPQQPIDQSCQKMDFNKTNNTSKSNQSKGGGEGAKFFLHLFCHLIWHELCTVFRKVTKWMTVQM